MKDLTIAPGHRYINDYYQYYRDNKPNDFVLLGQYNEFDLYALKQFHQWSLGARWSNEGSEYQSATYIDVLEKLNGELSGAHERYALSPTRIAAVRLYAFLSNQAKAFHGCIVGPVVDTCLSFSSHGGNFKHRNPRVWGITYPGTTIPDNVLRIYLEGIADMNHYYPLGSDSSERFGLFAVAYNEGPFALGFINDHGSSVSTIEGRTVSSLDGHVALWEEAYQAYGEGKHLTYPAFQFETPSSELTIPPEGRYENEQYRICREVHALNKFCWIGQWEEFDLYAVKKTDGYWHAYARTSSSDHAFAVASFFNQLSSTRLNEALADRHQQAVHRAIDNPLFQALVNGVDLITFEPDPNYIYQYPRYHSHTWADIDVVPKKFPSKILNINDSHGELTVPISAGSICTKDTLILSIAMDRKAKYDSVDIVTDDGRKYSIEITLIDERKPK